MTTKLIGRDKIVIQDRINNPDDSYESEQEAEIHGNVLMQGIGAAANTVRAVDAASAIAPYGVLAARNYGYATTPINVFFFVTYEFVPASSPDTSASANVTEITVINKSLGQVNVIGGNVEGQESVFNRMCVNCGNKLIGSEGIIEPHSIGRIEINFPYSPDTCWFKIKILYQKEPYPIELGPDSVISWP